jgi:hypothetical protein
MALLRSDSAKVPINYGGNMAMRLRMMARC